MSKLSDSRIMELAAEVKAIETEISARTAEILKRKTKIIAEMERRGTKAIEHGGKRITYVQSTSVIYDEDRILAGLTPKKVEKITKRVMDRGLLLAAVQNGTIKATFLDAHTTVRENAPYYRLSDL